MIDRAEICRVAAAADAFVLNTAGRAKCHKLCAEDSLHLRGPTPGRTNLAMTGVSGRVRPLAVTHQ
jgi:hypothetical protein